MIEIPAFLSLSDLVVKLLDQRNKRAKAYLEEVVKPCLESARIARDDLVSIYDAVEQSIHDGAALKEIEGEMLALRGAHLGTRDLLRGLLRDTPEQQLTDFERSIISLLGGARTHALMSLHLEIRLRSEAIFRLQQAGSGPERIDALRAEALGAVRHARETAEAAWRDIVAGYSAYVRLYVRNPA